MKGKRFEGSKVRRLEGSKVRRLEGSKVGGLESWGKRTIWASGLLLLSISGWSQTVQYGNAGYEKSFARWREWVSGKETDAVLFKPSFGKSFFPVTASPLPKPTGTAPAPAIGLKWNADDLPFFCRIEHQLGKKARTPFKFRLGTVEYVDFLEGK